MPRSKPSFPDPMFWQGRPTFLICLLTYEIQYNAELRWLDPSTDSGDVLCRRIDANIRSLSRHIQVGSFGDQHASKTLTENVEHFRATFNQAIRQNAERVEMIKRFAHIDAEDHAAYELELISKSPLMPTSWCQRAKDTKPSPRWGVMEADPSFVETLPDQLRCVWKIAEILAREFCPPVYFRFEDSRRDLHRAMREVDGIRRTISTTWPGLSDLETRYDPTESEPVVRGRLSQLLTSFPKALALAWVWPLQPLASPRTMCVLHRVKPGQLGSDVTTGDPPGVYYVPTADDVHILRRMRVVDASGRPSWSRLEKELVEISPEAVEPFRNLGVPALIAKIKQLRSRRPVGAGPTNDDDTAGIMKPEVAEGHTLLRALKKLKARTLETRKTLADIVEVAFKGEGRDPDNFKKVMGLLRKQGLVGAKKGRRGGYWLTHDGHAKASKKKKK